MERRHRVTAFLTAISFLLCSCATMQPSAKGEPRQWSSPQACVAAHTVGGAVVGAVAGALLAAVIGGGKSAGKGAAIGSITGGSLAFAYAWGKCFASFTKVKSVEAGSFRKASKEIGYKPSQGPVVRISEYTIQPSAIAPGDQPKMDATYYIMAPNERHVSATETLVLKVYNQQKNAFEEVGETSETIVVAPGRRKAVSQIPIPSNADESKFFIVFRVEMEGRTDEKEVPLIITRDNAIIAKAKAESRAPSRPEPPEEPADSVVVAAAGSKDVAVGVKKEVLVTAAKANIRENPNVKARIVAKASEGHKYPCLSTVTVDGKQWHHIEIGSGKFAWITASTCKLLAKQ